MVLQVLTDAGQMVHRVDAEPCQLVRVADARQLQQLRGVDRAAAQDDLGAAGQPGRAAGAAAGGSAPPGPTCTR